jgi:hypothetical protein
MAYLNSIADLEAYARATGAAAEHLERGEWAANDLERETGSRIAQRLRAEEQNWRHGIELRMRHSKPQEQARLARLEHADE